jgi:hypothetical protein
VIATFFKGTIKNPTHCPSGEMNTPRGLPRPVAPWAQVGPARALQLIVAAIERASVGSDRDVAIAALQR